jgi:hypothetical protein
VANKAAAAFDCTGAHIFCCCHFQWCNIYLCLHSGFAVATVVQIKGKGKIEQFDFVFSGFCSTTALPFTPSQNILQSKPKTRDILEYLILDLNTNAPGVL